MLSWKARSSFLTYRPEMYIAHVSVPIQYTPPKYNNANKSRFPTRRIDRRLFGGSLERVWTIAEAKRMPVPIIQKPLRKYLLGLARASR